MLLIRQEQFDAFAAADLARFEAKMIEHLQRVFPDWTMAQGREKLADFVRHGIRRANRYGFRVELDVARYLHVMQTLGRDFDESPEYPWAGNLLKSDTNAAHKMDRLRDAADFSIEARRITHAC